MADNKWVAPVVVIGGIIAAVLLLRRKGTAPLEGINPSGEISFGPGRGIGRGYAAAPASLTAGTTGNTQTVTITNTSTYVDGSLAPYNFNVGITLSVATIALITWAPVATGVIAAGATKTVTLTFDIKGSAGGSGAFAAVLLPKDDTNVLHMITAATATVPVVAGGAVTPGGTITF